MKTTIVPGIEKLEDRRLLSVGTTATFMNYVKGKETSRTFAILYDGLAAIDRTTLGDSDVRVTGPSNFAAFAKFTGTIKNRPDSGLVAQYQVDGIMGGSYSIEVLEGSVQDVDEDGFAGGVVGGFEVGRKGRTVPTTGDVALPPVVQVIGTDYGFDQEPPVLDTSFGPVVEALNFGGPAADLGGSTDVNIHFDAWSAVGGKKSRPRAASPFAVQINADPSGLSDATVGSDPIFETEIYSITWATETLTISGLNPGTQYRFLFLHGDGRLGSVQYVSTPQKFSLPTGEYAITPLEFNTQTSNQTSVTTVEVSGTTGLIYGMPASPTRGPSFSAMVIEAGGSVTPPAPRPTPVSASFVRKSTKLVGSGQTFDIEYPPGVDSQTIASQPVMLSGARGYSAIASLVGVTVADDGVSSIATYRIDGIDATGIFTVSVGGQRVADVTFFYLRPVVWA